MAKIQINEKKSNNNSLKLISNMKQIFKKSKFSVKNIRFCDLSLFVLLETKSCYNWHLIWNHTLLDLEEPMLKVVTEVVFWCQNQKLGPNLKDIQDHICKSLLWEDILWFLLLTLVQFHWDWKKNIKYVKKYFATAKSLWVPAFLNVVK